MALADQNLQIPATVDVLGDLILRGAFRRGWNRSELTQDNLLAYPLETSDWRVWDSYGTDLGSAASDDLGIGTGTFGTGLPYISAGDLKAAGATTRRARILFTLPAEYVAGETVQIRAAAGMLTTIADTSCTIDFECYKSNRDTTKTGSDLVTTSATTINSTTFGEKTFAVTSTGLSPGDVLDIRLSIACNDGATGTAVTPAVAHVEMQLDVKG